MTIAAGHAAVTLAEPERAHAAQAAAGVSEYLRRLADRLPRRMTLEAEAGGHPLQVTVPEAALRLLVDVLHELANGSAVTVLPLHAEVTTQQAADLLNVSRPYVVKLLEEGRIPYRTVGPRRRIQLADLMTFKHTDDALRRHVADELTRQAAELELGYDDDA